MCSANSKYFIYMLCMRLSLAFPEFTHTCDKIILLGKFNSYYENKNMCIRNTYCPSLKYSFSVVLNFFEYFTNSFLRCSTACLPVTPGIKFPISLTTSSSFLMALAISLKISGNKIIQNKTINKVIIRFQVCPLYA